MKLADIILEGKPNFEVKGIGLTYTDFGRFYGAYLHPLPQTANLPFGTPREKLHFDEASEYIKNLTGLELPRNYAWMTLGQLNSFLKYNNFVNIQARSILSALQYIA